MCSAPHGAGRLLSRSKAHEKLDMTEYEEQMKDVITFSVNKSTLDEAPNAYRSIEEIQEAVKDTVEITSIAKVVYNFKN